MKLIRLDYLLHRWIGSFLGALVFVWFASGIVMLYYPYPTISDARELRTLHAFQPDTTLIGFRRAWEAAEHSLGLPEGSHELVSGRLLQIGSQPVYRFQREHGDVLIPAALVDARTGRVLSPISPELAVTSARALVPVGSPVDGLELIPSGEHYMMDVAYAPQFPAYRVRFADPASTAIYVNAAGGNPFGVVTTFTRFTTWTGTVPHWFYFIWLYDRPGLWDAAFIAAGALIVLLALTGIVWGFSRLRKGTQYYGISRWHHLSGIGFGFLVLTWTASGVYQNFAAGNLPRTGQAARLRGGATHWENVPAFTPTGTAFGPPVAVDLVQFDDRPAFVVHYPAGRSVRVDAATGAPSPGLLEPELRRAAVLAMGDAFPLAGLENITGYDTYYYARHGRELPLPVWRLSFKDPEGTRLYLDPVSGAPTGFVDAASKRARWLRDAVHSLDFPALNNHRPLWDLVILPLLLAGLLLSGTGVAMLLRRLLKRRISISRSASLRA